MNKISIPANKGKEEKKKEHINFEYVGKTPRGDRKMNM